MIQSSIHYIFGFNFSKNSITYRVYPSTNNHIYLQLYLAKVSENIDLHNVSVSSHFWLVNNFKTHASCPGNPQFIGYINLVTRNHG